MGNKNVKKSLASGDAKPKASPAGKKKKDPNAPKLPKSAFSEFMEEHMVKKRAEGQKVNIIELQQEVGPKWREMSTDDKQPYNDMAAENKKKYEIELAAYKESNPSGEANQCDTPNKTPKTPAPVNTPNKNVKKSLASGDTKSEASPAVKKKKEKRDPNLPKLPTTAYMQFSNAKRQEMTAKGQKVDILAQAKISGA